MRLRRLLCRLVGHKYELHMQYPPGAGIAPGLINECRRCYQCVTVWPIMDPPPSRYGVIAPRSGLYVLGTFKKELEAEAPDPHDQPADCFGG